MHFGSDLIRFKTKQSQFWSLMEIKQSLSEKTSDKSTVYIGLRYLQLSSSEAASKGSKINVYLLFYTKEGMIKVDKGKAEAGKARHTSSLPCCGNSFFIKILLIRSSKISKYL